MMAHSPSKSYPCAQACAAVAGNRTTARDADHQNSAQPTPLDSRPSTPWSGPIPFEVLDPFTHCYAVTNILEYVSNPLVYNNHIIRFPSSYTLDENGVKDLKNAIIKSATEHSGGLIRLENTRGRRLPSWSFCCIHAGIYRGNKFDEQGKELPIEKADREIADDLPKQDGRKAARRSRGTMRRFSSSQPRCPFRLTIFRDDQSYFFKGGKGCSNHQYHHRLDPSKASSTNAAKKEEKLKKQATGKRGRPRKTKEATATMPSNKETAVPDCEDDADFGDICNHDDDEIDFEIANPLTTAQDKPPSGHSRILAMAHEMNSLLDSVGNDAMTDEIMRKQAELLELTKAMVAAHCKKQTSSQMKRGAKTNPSPRKRRKKH